MNANMGDFPAAKAGNVALYRGTDYAVTGLTMRVAAFL